MSNFVDTVYDAYIKDDYKFGDDNLNPKHEIKQARKQNIDDELNNLLARIKEKTDEINDRWADLDSRVIAEEPEDLNFGAAISGEKGNNGQKPLSEKLAIQKAGGDPTDPNAMILDIGSPNNTPGISIPEIEDRIQKLMLKIIASIPNTTGPGPGPEPDYWTGTGSTDGEPTGPGPISVKVPTIIIDPTDEIGDGEPTPLPPTIITWGTNSDGTRTYPVTPDTGDSTPDGGKPSGGPGGSPTFTIGEFGGGDATPFTYTSPTSTPEGYVPSPYTHPAASILDGIALHEVDCQYTTNVFTGLVDTGDNNEESEGNDEEEEDEEEEIEYGSADDLNEREQNNALAEAEAALQQCALADIAWLKIFLVILNVIKVIKAILNPALNIIVEIIEIVTLSVGIWCNPAGAAEIVQKIAQKIIAILLGLVGKVIQQIWNMLGLDCVTSQVRDTIAQIQQALTDINAIYGEVVSTCVSFSSTTDAMKKALEEAKKSINDYMDQIEDLKNNASDLVPDIISKDPEKRKAAVQQLQQSAVSGAKAGLSGWKEELGGEALSDVYSAISEAKQVTKSIADITALFKSAAGTASGKTIEAMGKASAILSGN